MTERNPLEPRVVALADPVELLVLAAGANPFFETSAILDRQIVEDDIGLLVGGPQDQPTCLFLWVTPLRDLGPWMVHAARWLGLYPGWRRLHGLGPSDLPVRIVLAAPDVGEGVRTAVNLISVEVVLTRYTCIRYGLSRRLSWEGWEENEAQDQSTPLPRVHGDTGTLAGMSDQELAFFRHR